MFAPTFQPTQPVQPTQPMAMNPSFNPGFPQPAANQSFKIDDKDIPMIWGQQFKQVIEGYYQL
jgi:hypothetical protein